MPLKTHLLAWLDGNRFATACGIEGIPLTNQAHHNFRPDRDTYEGRIPGGCGRGVVAARSRLFGVPCRYHEYCARCAKRYANGEGV